MRLNLCDWFSYYRFVAYNKVFSQARTIYRSYAFDCGLDCNNVILASESSSASRIRFWSRFVPQNDDLRKY